MKTKLHHYYFKLTAPEDAKAWSELEKQLLAQGYGPGKMHSWGGAKDPENRNDVEEVEIEADCLFDNQWNTTDKRVFDWYQYYEVQGLKLARGHWLELTPEMLAARHNTLKCGYCGKHYGPLHEPPPANGFCDACLDSPYLKESDLNLLRLRSLDQERTESGKHASRPPLTKAERDDLLPRYIERQTTGNDSRAKARRDKQRADVLQEYEQDTAKATTERDGKLWLWDKGIDLDNVIFYSHTGRFCFGWRSPVSASVESKLLDILSEFPFSYEIKSETGTKEAA